MFISKTGDDEDHPYLLACNREELESLLLSLDFEQGDLPENLLHWENRLAQI